MIDEIFLLYDFSSRNSQFLMGFTFFFFIFETIKYCHKKGERTWEKLSSIFQIMAIATAGTITDPVINNYPAASIVIVSVITCLISLITYLAVTAVTAVKRKLKEQKTKKN